MKKEIGGKKAKVHPKAKVDLSGLHLSACASSAHNNASRVGGGRFG